MAAIPPRLSIQSSPALAMMIPRKLVVPFDHRETGSSRNRCQCSVASAATRVPPPK